MTKIALSCNTGVVVCITIHIQINLTLVQSQ